MTQCALLWTTKWLYVFVREKEKNVPALINILLFVFIEKAKLLCRTHVGQSPRDYINSHFGTDDKKKSAATINRKVNTLIERAKR